MFYLQVTNSGADSEGLYGIQDINNGADAEDMAFGLLTSATAFTFNDACNLIASNGNIAIRI